MSKRDEKVALKQADTIAASLNFCIEDAAAGSQEELFDILRKDIPLSLAMLAIVRRHMTSMRRALHAIQSRHMITYDIDLRTVMIYCLAIH